MQITIRQSGGLAGETVDVAALDTDLAATAAEPELEKILADLGFSSMAEAGGSGPIGADLPAYEVTVTRGEATETAVITTDQPEPPAPVRALLEAIARLG